MKNKKFNWFFGTLTIGWLTLTILFFVLVADRNNKQDSNIRQKSSSQFGGRFFYPSLKK